MYDQLPPAPDPLVTLVSREDAEADLETCVPRDPVDSAAPAEGAEVHFLDFMQRPGVQRVFVHDSVAVGVDSLNESRGLAKNVHAERAVLLAQAGDLVVLDRELDHDYRWFLERIGIGPARNDVLALSAERGPASARASAGAKGLFDMLEDAAALGVLAERLDLSREVRLSPYYASDAAFGIAGALARLTGRPVSVDGGSAAAVALSNRKDLVRDQARSLDVPWSEGELVSWVDRHDDGFDLAAALAAAIRRVRSTTGGVFIRGVWSMHGSDNLRVPSGGMERARVADWLRGRPAQRAFLVEPLLPVCASPNVQMWIDDDGGVHSLAITGQRLSPSLVHQGNMFPYRSPLTSRIEASAVAIARWLSTAGYRGPLGLDFLETRDPRTGGEVALLVEVNGRINGATYVLGAVERLDRRRRAMSLAPLGHWRSATEVATHFRSFAQLAEAMGDLLYIDRCSAGVIPYNVGMLQHGAAYLLMVASRPDELDALEQAVGARMCSS